LVIQSLPGRRRLAALAALVPPGARVADVGSDHGRLPRLLLAAGRARACIATERDPTRLARLARALPGRPGLELRAGDGLAALRADDALDVVVIAGLGARSILRILDAGDLGALGWPRLVLSPQSPAAALRAWLVARGWALRDGRLVHERGRFYEILAAAYRPDLPPPTHAALDEEALIAAGPELLARGEAALGDLWRERLAHAVALRASAAAGGLARAARDERVARAVLTAIGAETGI
jgi:tRNA (adenine22-N1)-methyltransferase